MAALSTSTIEGCSWPCRVITLLVLLVCAAKAATTLQTFGTVAVGSTSAPAEVAFAMPTIVGSASASVRGPSDFNITGPVACDSICRVAVAFSPRASGMRKAALVITDSATGRANTVALLSGIGSAPQLAVLPGTISIAVGIGPPIGSGYGQPIPGLANQTKMQTPQSLALDSTGNLYIADALSNVVLKFAPKDGTVSIVAGTGAPGYTGDGALASQATLNGPGGIAVDGAGNVFIADTGNNVVRIVYADTQIIDTFAGGGIQSGTDGLGDGEAAKDAMLSGPSGLAVDIYGNVYISDTFNNVIRKVGGSGTISVLAGCAPGGAASQGNDGLGDGELATSATLGYPSGLALDTSNGRLFIADTYNDLIRVVDLSTNRISAVAGNGSSGYWGDGSLAVNAELNAPNGIDLDSAGNLYIADSNNNAVRRVDVSTGIIETIVGVGGEAGYILAAAADAALIGNPYGLAVDSFGNIFIADYSNYVVEEVSTSANQVYEFPSTPVGQGAEFEPGAFKILNVGNDSLNIYGIQLSGDFQINLTDAGVNCGSQMILGAGDNCEIPVVFKPQGVGMRPGVLQISSNSENNPSSINAIALTGVGTASLADAFLSSNALNFGLQQIGTVSAAQSVVLSNTGSAPLMLGSVGVSGDFGAVSNCGTSLAVGAQCTISVTFNPLMIGVREGVLAIDTTDSKLLTEITLTGFGMISVNSTPQRGHTLVAGDYDRDGKKDISIWREGTWFVSPSSNPLQPLIQGWGMSGDIPVPGDYDGDGKTDMAVWRQGTWFVILSSNPTQHLIQGWGISGDIPL